MARNLEIENILEAWWQLNYCPPADKGKSRKRLNELLDTVVAKSDGVFTREQILDHLWPQYKDYRDAKRRDAKLGVAQSAMKK